LKLPQIIREKIKPRIVVSNKNKRIEADKNL
jgi:hypothetical protein